MAKVCLYHGNDLDGICAAAIVKYKYPEAKLFPVEYNSPVEYKKMITNGDEVIVLDYMIQPFSHMVLINMMCDLTWIDHHKSSIDDYEEYMTGSLADIDSDVPAPPPKPIKGSRRVGCSACELAWEFLFPNTPIPYSVWLLGRYDVFAHDESQSIIPFQYGMKVEHHPPEDAEYWANMFTGRRDSDIIQDVIKAGNIIIRYRNTLNARICETQAFDTDLFGNRCICVNRALCGSSVFNSVYDPEKHDMMAVFYICKRGSWNVSLYTDKKDVDVSEIAKKYGGGGHAGAAGFRCTLLPFEIVS